VQETQKRQFDKRTFVSDLKIGERVYITAMSDPERPKKFQVKFQGPYTLNKEMGKYNYLLMDKLGKTIIVHHDRMKKVKQGRNGDEERNVSHEQRNEQRMEQEGSQFHDVIIMDDEEDQLVNSRREETRELEIDDDLLSLGEVESL